MHNHLLNIAVKNKSKQDSLKRLEQVFSELNECSQDNIINFTKKFTEYYRQFKEIFTECIKGYDLKSPYAP
jgi:hypothetical protein